MSNRIIYSQTTQTGKSLAQAVNKVMEAAAELRRVKAVLDKAVTGDDWPALAAEVGGGITSTGGNGPGGGGGRAYDLWYMVSASSGALDAQCAELARLDQG